MTAIKYDQGSKQSTSFRVRLHEVNVEKSLVAVGVPFSPDSNNTHRHSEQNFDTIMQLPDANKGYGNIMGFTRVPADMVTRTHKRT